MAKRKGQKDKQGSIKYYKDKYIEQHKPHLKLGVTFQCNIVSKSPFCTPSIIPYIIYIPFGSPFQNKLDRV